LSLAFLCTFSFLSEDEHENEDEDEKEDEYEEGQTLGGHAAPPRTSACG
jgi:hypothetical protein